MLSLRSVIYFIYFAIPVRRFHAQAYSLQGVREEMNALNFRRMKIQQEIVEISCSVTICRECRGFCCRGDYNHFTIIDYLVRSFSDKPIHDYGLDLKMVDPLYLVITRKILNMLKRRDAFEFRRCNSSTIASTNCPDSSCNGCQHLPEDRPIRCIIWTCSSYRNEFTAEQLYRIGELTRELCLISSKVTRLFNSY